MQMGLKSAIAVAKEAAAGGGSTNRPASSEAIKRAEEVGPDRCFEFAAH